MSNNINGDKTAKKPEKYTDFLGRINPGVCNRLAACSNKKADIPILVDTRWEYLKKTGKDQEGFTKEDALVEILDWLDSNGQWQLADISTDEYDRLKR